MDLFEPIQKWFGNDSDPEARHFTALGNVDETILDWNLKHDYEVQKIEFHKLVFWIEAITNREKVESDLPNTATFRRLWPDYWEVLVTDTSEEQPDNCYVITNNRQITPRDEESGFPPDEVSELSNLTNSYLREKIRLARLFKRGNICPVLNYTYSTNHGAYMWWETPHHLYNELFHLQEGEAEKLTRFVHERELPLQVKRVREAHDYLRQSYDTMHNAPAFVSAITGLEVLFSGSGGGITHKLARRGAVLLGSDEKECEDIFSDLKDLYGLRSSLVHSGGEIPNDKLDDARDYLRRAIRAADDIGQRPQNLQSKLDRLGFGDGSAL